MAGRRVKMLVILGGNPVYTAPADLNSPSNSKKVPLRIHLGLYQDETAALCDWHIPEAHYLESWSDGSRLRRHGQHHSAADRAAVRRAAPRTNCWRRSANRPNAAGLEIVRETGGLVERTRSIPADFEEFWQQSLQEGVIAGTDFAPRIAS